MAKRKVLLIGRNNEPAEVLMVPWFPQHDTDNLCFPASLMMVMYYYSDYYENAEINAATPKMSLDQIADMCLCSRENGTRIDNDLAARISEGMRALRATLKLGYSLEEVRKHAEKGLPTILIYDGHYLLTGLRGGAHAGVYIGTAKNGDPILNNPWVSSLVPYPRPKFEDAWDIRRRRALIIEPVVQKKIDGETQ